MRYLLVVSLLVLGALLFNELSLVITEASPERIEALIRQTGGK
jgi:hypothetical protein